MSWLRRLEHGVRRWWFQRPVEVWYHPEYRLPITSLSSLTKFETRRSDFVLWYLLDRKVLKPEQVRQPRRVPYADLARVHTCDYLESLTHAKTLAHIYAVDEWDLPVDEVARTVRLATGATVRAAHRALETGVTAFNLLGGFHHASPHRGGGMCALNDIAVAIASLRHEGMDEQIVVLDLDAHPPDGLVDCLKDDEKVWIGSLSGSDWGGLPEADETVLPPGTGDDAYLRALGGLLSRMPKAKLAFVIAGGDVLAEDHMGLLGLTLHGARMRDKTVADALDGTPSVWLPGGGYHPDSWRVLAGSLLYLSLRSERPIREDLNPLSLQFKKIALSFAPEELEGDVWLTDDDLAELGMRSNKLQRFLDYYTVEGIEVALYRYGILGYVRRLGYAQFEVKIDRSANGERMRVLGLADGEEHLLVESVLEKKPIMGRLMLYIHWLTLRHPRAAFDEKKPALPGQEVPGLGMAKEAGELLDLMARRLHLDGVAFQPAWFHIAYAMRKRFRFIDPERQGRFEALVRDMGDIPLVEMTQLVAQGRVLCNDEPFHWQSDVMAFLAAPDEEYEKAVEEARDAVSFHVASSSASASLFID
jgi:acetoin utilization deacetylase AcuC-like enzyme